MVTTAELPMKTDKCHYIQIVSLSQMKKYTQYMYDIKFLASMYKRFFCNYETGAFD